MKLLAEGIEWQGVKVSDQLDFELQNRVTDYLLERDEHAFHSLRIDVDHGTVTLIGNVRTYYEKQVAMSCVKVAGVLQLINRLEVPEWDFQEDQSEYPFRL